MSAQAWRAFDLGQNDTPVANLLEYMQTVSSDNRVTLVLGAGLSMDSGLPSWTELVDRLVKRAISHHISLMHSDSDGSRTAELEQSLHDQVRAATSSDHLRAIGWAKVLLGDDYIPAIHDALYQDDGCGHFVGPLAIELAKLVVRLGDGVKVMTTNFDDTLERALQGVRGGTAVPAPVHIHGYVPFGGTPDREVVLSSDEFAIHGQRIVKKLSEALRQGRGVFVGMSLADFNIISALTKLKPKKSRSKPPLLPSRAPASHFGVFVDQVESAGTDYGEEREIFAELNSRQLKSSLNLEVVRLKSYSQVAQLVHEMRSVHRRGSRYFLDRKGISHDYVSRLHRWRRDVDDGTSEESWAMFAYSCTQVLNEALEQIEDILGISSANARHEKLAVHVWLRLEKDYEIELTAASTHVHRERWSQGRRERIVGASKLPAVEAVFTGRPTCMKATDPPRRSGISWGTILGVPIFLDGAEHGHLLCGAATLSSTGLATFSSLGGSRVWQEYFGPDRSRRDAMTTTLAMYGARIASPQSLLNEA